MEEKKEKTAYQQIIDGDREPEGSEKGWKNLQPEKYNFSVMDKEKRREICQKGAAAVNKLHGQKKTAREALENILTLKVTDEIIAGADLTPAMADRLKRSCPDATIYDLIQIVAAGRAVGGNLKAYELIRDTYGDKPVDRVEVSDVTTEADREMMRNITERLKEGGRLEVVKDISTAADTDKSITS